MSQDLEKAINDMRDEPLDQTTLEAARARVWNQLANAGEGTCGEFRPELPAYVSGALGGGRRVLLEDHLTRCPACRAALAELRGTRTVVAMPKRTSLHRTRWLGLAAAAALA